jgi:hypothetical protein
MVYPKLVPERSCGGFCGKSQKEKWTNWEILQHWQIPQLLKIWWKGDSSSVAEFVYFTKYFTARANQQISLSHPTVIIIIC